MKKTGGVCGPPGPGDGTILVRIAAELIFVNFGDAEVVKAPTLPA
jgi:hypothetical protein